MKFGDFVKKFVEDPDRENLTIEDYDQEINTAHSKSKNIVITDEFKNIIDGLLNSKKIFHFVSGVAGTGKSTLINEIRKLKDTNVIVVAPTGISAINVGGTTIHSAFRPPPKIFPEPEYMEYKAPIFEMVDRKVMDFYRNYF